jgi:hypothetical protein
MRHSRLVDRPAEKLWHDIREVVYHVVKAASNVLFYRAQARLSVRQLRVKLAKKSPPASLRVTGAEKFIVFLPHLLIEIRWRSVCKYVRPHRYRDEAALFRCV